MKQIIIIASVAASLSLQITASDNTIWRDEELVSHITSLMRDARIPRVNEHEVNDQAKLNHLEAIVKHSLGARLADHNRNHGRFFSPVLRSTDSSNYFQSLSPLRFHAIRTQFRTYASTHTVSIVNYANGQYITPCLEIHSESMYPTVPEIFYKIYNNLKRGILNQARPFNGQ